MKLNLHTWIWLAIAVGSSGRCSISCFNFQCISALLFTIENDFCENFTTLEIYFEEIFAFISWRVDDVIINLLKNYFKYVHNFNLTNFYLIIGKSSISIDGIDLCDFCANRFTFQNSFLFTLCKQRNFIVDIFQHDINCGFRCKLLSSIILCVGIAKISVQQDN